MNNANWDKRSVSSATVWWSGNLGMLAGTLVPWLMMLVQQRPMWLIGLYTVLALLAFAVKFLTDFGSSWWSWWCHRPWLMLFVEGMIGLALQTISGDPFVQPAFFTVPLVYGAFVYPLRRNILVGFFYLGLVALGLWWNGSEPPQAVGLAVAAYGAAMFFMDAFARLAVEQGRARAEADQLAADLARQRDYLARLVQITATLTRELDIGPVLEQVAAAGRMLAHAGQVRVWLREEGDDDEGVRLAAAVPALRHALPSESVDEALLRASAIVAPNRLLLPLAFKDRAIGVLELSDRPDAAFTSDEVTALQPFADTAAVAIEHARLYEQARLSATLAERNRIARELHDTIAQGLTAVTMQLEAAQRSFERDAGRTRTRLGRAHTLARETLADVRRSVWTLAAPLVDGQALREELAAVAQRFAERTAIAVSYTHDGPPPTLDHASATQLLRIVQEALQNVEKHAQASAVEVRSLVDDAGFSITVRDNGVGFAHDALPHANGQGSGFGLISLRERARLVGAHVVVESAPGAGTQVAVTLVRPDGARSLEQI